MLLLEKELPLCINTGEIMVVVGRLAVLGCEFDEVDFPFDNVEDGIALPEPTN